MEQEHNQEQNPKKVQERNPSKEAWEWGKALGVALIITFIIRFFLLAPIVVDGQSMIPSLHDGERLIVNKAVYYWSEPERGEIVVFHALENKDWIKRVIGEPGDTIEVRNGVLYINGEEINEFYLDESSKLATHDFHQIVGEDELFVMGDNRANSRDSRSIGSIPVDSVVGRAEFVFWPLSELRWVKTE